MTFLSWNCAPENQTAVRLYRPSALFEIREGGCEGDWPGAPVTGHAGKGRLHGHGGGHSCDILAGQGYRPGQNPMAYLCPSYDILTFLTTLQAGGFIVPEEAMS